MAQIQAFMTEEHVFFK